MNTPKMPANCDTCPCNDVSCVALTYNGDKCIRTLWNHYARHTKTDDEISRELAGVVWCHAHIDSWTLESMEKEIKKYFRKKDNKDRLINENRKR